MVILGNCYSGDLLSCLEFSEIKGKVRIRREGPERYVTDKEIFQSE